MEIGIHRHKKHQQKALKQKALEPHQRLCRILKKMVNILIEYYDYKSPRHKGEEGTIYCENILDCYQNDVRCRYSGISPLYPDPFWGTPEEYGESPEPEQKGEQAEPEG